MHPALTRSLLLDKPVPMSRFLWASCLAHALLVLMVIGVNQLQRSSALNLDQVPIKASLVRLGKPRDPNLLPQKEEPPPPPPEAKPVPAPVPQPAPTPPPAAVAIPSPKAPPAPSRPSGDNPSDARQKLFGAFKSQSQTPRSEPLEGAADGDPSGDAARAEGERYFGMLSAQVKRHYDVSQTIGEQERMYLTARVGVRIGRTGEVLRVALAKASGNELFDAAVLAAVKKASPFSPPPDHLRESLQREGIVLEFKP